MFGTLTDNVTHPQKLWLTDRPMPLTENFGRQTDGCHSQEILGHRQNDRTKFPSNISPFYGTRNLDVWIPHKEFDSCSRLCGQHNRVLFNTSCVTHKQNDRFHTICATRRRHSTATIGNKRLTILFGATPMRRSEVERNVTTLNLTISTKQQSEGCQRYVW